MSVQTENDKLAMERWGVEADKFLNDPKNGGWVRNKANIDRITAAMRSLGLVTITAGNFRLGMLDAKDRGVLELEPAAPVVDRRTREQILFEIGEPVSTHRSVTEIAEERKISGATIREHLDAAVSHISNMAKDAQQSENEQVVVYIESGPLAGKINHGATNRAREAAKAKRSR